jgi:hypothetical protein
LGALVWPVASTITESGVLHGTPVVTGAIGVKERLRNSGARWELIKEFEGSVARIAVKAVELMGVKKLRFGESVAEAHAACEKHA